MHDEKSNIERHADMGQSSGQLAERNALKRYGLYGGLGAVAFGILASLVAPSFAVPFVFVGLLLGVGLAVAIEQKAKREDDAKRAQVRAERAKEEERELQARIKAAEENGAFDRWDKP